MFMIYLHTKFHMPIASSSSAFFMELKARDHFAMLLYILKTIFFNKTAYISKHNSRTLN
jgi:hypothetical protein